MPNRSRSVAILAALMVAASVVHTHVNPATSDASPPSAEERVLTGILVVYELRVTPGEEERFRRGWTRVTQAAVRAAGGARGSVLTRSQERPDTYVAIARWESEAQWRAYRSGEHLTRRRWPT